jgi:hypothetical protein
MNITEEIKKLREEIEFEQNNCEHEWEKPEEKTEIKRKTIYNADGTVDDGDSYDSYYWERKCKKCEKTQRTNEKECTKYRRVWRELRDISFIDHLEKKGYIKDE